MLNYYPLLIPLAPLLAAVYSALPSRRADESKYTFGVIAHVVGFAVAVVALVQVIASDGSAIRLTICETSWSFLPEIELSIDRLSAVMMVVITSIGLVLYRYSVRYLQSEVGQPRYQTLLALTISTLLVMVSSRDLVLLYLAWQLLSWLLCLLSYNYAHLPTARSSFRTFITLRLGDIAFLAGIVLSFHLYGTVEFEALFEAATAEPVTLEPFGSGFAISGATAITFLIFVGAMSKSAQIPLHMWLPDSLFAPTPIHGLLHAGIINAGGFLLTRLAPLYVLSTATLHFVFAIGLLTAVLGTSMMLVQNDIKKTLGYSTIGQMGYMIMECGLGAFSLAIFHLIAHGLFKATIFLNCGNVIHETRQEPRSPSRSSEEQPKIGAVNWVIGFIVSLALPFVIVVGAHKLLHIPMLDSQGLAIFLFFSWVTAAQAMLTLYRLHGMTSFKAQGILLVVVALITGLYLFAAEQFTSFLYPSPETVTRYFEAAALPNGLFVTIIAVVTAVIIFGWVMSFAQRQGRSLFQFAAVTDIQTTLYLLFVNRLYLDGVALRLRRFVKDALEGMDRSWLTLPVAALFAIIIAATEGTTFSGLTAEAGGVLVLSALFLPLFPLHGLYVGAVTKLPRLWALLLAVVMPAAGAFGLAYVTPQLPNAILPGLTVLALVGAVYATIKAMVQNSVPHLFAYAGCAFFSILWWHVADTGSLTHDAAMYIGSVVLVTAGMLLAWDCARSRYGELPLNQIGGLARPMPKFGVCLALVVMAAVGLPPFGLIFSYLGLLFSSSGMSLGLVVVLTTWFGASWYLFKFMQRLLFGPHREDIRYDDLRPAEIGAFVMVLLLLFLLSAVPHRWLSPEGYEVARAAVEIK